MARQRTDPDYVNLPVNATTSQLRHIDGETARLQLLAEQRQVEDEQIYRVVRVVINGLTLPISVNIADLRNALGLPDYPLMPVFRSPMEADDPEVNREISQIVFFPFPQPQTWEWEMQWEIFSCISQIEFPSPMSCILNVIKHRK